MHYTIEPIADGHWQVVNALTKETYGQPLRSLSAAHILVQQAEASINIRRMTECRTGGCSL